MVATFLTDRRPTFMIDYDVDLDVLRVVTKHFASTEGLGLSQGIELDFDAQSNTPSGFTIVGFHRNDWDRHIDKLLKLVADHTSIDPKLLESAILDKTRENDGF